MKRTHRTLAGAAIAAALLLGACSSSGDDDAKDDAAEETTTTSTTEAAPVDDPQARAESVDLELEDFGEGWTASAPETTEDTDGIAECAPELVKDDQVLAEFDTDTFSTGDLDNADGTQFSASTRVYVDEETATAVLEPFSDEEFIACVDTSFKDTVSQGDQLTVEGEMTDDDIDVGTDDAQGLSGEYTITGPDGTSVPLNVGLLAMRSGDVVTLVRILSMGESLDPTTLADPLATLAERQTEA